MSELNPKKPNERQVESKSSDAISPGIPRSSKKAYELHDDDDDDDSLQSLAKKGREDEVGLKSLAQAARGNQLKQARWTMIAIGVLTVIANIAMFISNLGIVVDPQFRTELVFIQITNIVFALLGVIFILLGIFVQKSPLICTVSGLVLYVLSWLVSIALNPLNIAAGIIFKIIVVVALFKAIQSARAYEAEIANNDSLE